MNTTAPHPAIAKENLHGIRLPTRFVMLLLISTMAIGECYDKTTDVPDDSWYIIRQDCTRAASCKTGSSCSHDVREKATDCDSSIAATGKVCSMEWKTRKWKYITGTCVVKPNGSCGCGNMTSQNGPPESYRTGDLTECPEG